MKKSYLLFFMIIAFVSCDTKNNCDDILCTSPIPFVSLNIVNAESGENLFANGIYSIEDVQLLNAQNEPVFVRINSENNLESTIGDIVGNNEYRLLISPELEIQISVIVVEAGDSCCSTPNLTDLNVLNYEFEETSARSYTIFID